MPQTEGSGTPCSSSLKRHTAGLPEDGSQVHLVVSGLTDLVSRSKDEGAASNVEEGRQMECSGPTVEPGETLILVQVTSKPVHCLLSLGVPTRLYIGGQLPSLSRRLPHGTVVVWTIVQ